MTWKSCWTHKFDNNKWRW